MQEGGDIYLYSNIAFAEQKTDVTNENRFNLLLLVNILQISD